MKICDGIYAHIWKGVFENNCNMYYFGEPLNMLIDPGLKNYLNIRFQDMADDGFDPKKIAYIVNTHCHPDHFEGSLDLAGKDTPICMHKDEIDFFNHEGPEFFHMFGMPFPDITFDKVLTEGDWEVNGVKLQVYHTPGHSPGSICIHWPEKKALACGDLIFEQSFGRTDFPGGDMKLLIQSIEKMSTLDIEYLLPGHMNAIIGESNIQRNFEMLRQYFSMV